VRRRWLLTLATVVALATTASPMAAHAASLDELCTRVSQEAGAAPVKMAVVVIDLASGQRCDVNGQQTFDSASLYKLVVLADAYEQQAAGTFSFTEPLTIEPRHSVDNPPEFQLTDPIQTTTGAATRAMIQMSDNPSAAALRERLGFDAVAAEPAHLGMTHTELGANFVTTADDIAHFFDRLYHGAIVDPQSSNQMLQILLSQQENDLIPAALPAGVVVAHKTGELDTVLHDAGIVYAPAGDYVLVTMTQFDGNYPAAIDAIHAVSKLVYDAYRGSTPPTTTTTKSVSNAAAGASSRAAQSAPVAAAAQPRPAPLVITESSEPLWRRLDTSGFGILALAALVLAPAMMFGVRLLAARRGRPSAEADAGSRLWPAERDHGMRFGNRRDDEMEAMDTRRQQVPPAAAGMQTGIADEAPLLPSRRLQRVADLFRSHTELLEGMRVQFQDELQPLNELLARQNSTMQQMLFNLEERLRPLNDYADSEETNLESLERRMREAGSDFVARSFSEYVQQQRKRIAETRQQIEQQRTPFMQYGEDQRDAIEVALARFDDDVEALELNLVEQRKIMIRMLDSMRSDSFGAVKEFLQNREEVMAEMATSGMTDPGEIGRSVQALRQSIEALARESAHIQSVLQTTDEADKRLTRSAPAGPRPLRNQEPTRETVAVAGDDEEATA
jgi:beta-lactamase class A